MYDWIELIVLSTIHNQSAFESYPFENQNRMHKYINVKIHILFGLQIPTFSLNILKQEKKEEKEKQISLTYRW